MGHHARKKPSQPEESAKEKLKLIKKERKEKLKEKRARLIVRNLPFQVTEENLKAHFEKFGEIDHVQILKKEDGQMVGCGFVQFKLVQKAAKARHHLDGKPFLDREISVDFAMAKNKFLVQEDVEVKQEDEIKIKEEPLDPDLDEIKKEEEEEENVLEDTVVEDVKEEDVQEKEDAQSDDKEVENDENKVELDESKIEIDNSDVETDDSDVEIKESEEDDESDPDEDVKSEEESEPPAKKPRFESNDVNEGKTIFIKNVPFAATNEDLKECMRQFGRVYYALICIDKFTQHSKGTAFVKFVDQEDAEKALAAGTELTLLGNILDCHKALGRNEIHQKAAAHKEEKKGPKDSRNLYLVKEGVILAGSKAAEGVSATDMAKRLQLEQYKTQMLRNLNKFVSRDRIVIHNLPPSWDDTKLRALVKNNSPKNAIIREARIMRDLKNVDSEGVGRSKEFGFVTFNRHEDALAALRTLNNNPNVFSANKRPIVAFSIENKAMIKAKQKRLEKSRLKNPNCKMFDPNVVKADKEKKERKAAAIENGEKKDFAGVAAKPGVQKMRSRYNLKTQAKLHYENVKKEKKKAKFAKKSFKERKQEFTKQPKQKMNKKKNDDSFAKLVSNYKKKLMGPPEEKKKKWYEES